jgi:hypothetical protein
MADRASGHHRPARPVYRGCLRPPNPGSFPTTTKGAKSLVAGRGVALPYGVMTGPSGKSGSAGRPMDWQGALPFNLQPMGGDAALVPC